MCILSARKLSITLKPIAVSVSMNCYNSCSKGLSLSSLHQKQYLCWKVQKRYLSKSLSLKTWNYFIQNNENVLSRKCNIAIDHETCPNNFFVFDAKVVVRMTKKKHSVLQSSTPLTYTTGSTRILKAVHKFQVWVIFSYILYIGHKSIAAGRVVLYFCTLYSGVNRNSQKEVFYKKGVLLWFLQKF